VLFEKAVRFLTGGWARRAGVPTFHARFILCLAPPDEALELVGRNGAAKDQAGLRNGSAQLT